MLFTKHSLPIPRRLLLAYRHTAAISRTTLSHWIEFCCCSMLDDDLASSIRFPVKRSSLKIKSPPTLEQVNSAGSNPTSLKFGIMTRVLAAWHQQAEREQIPLDHWIISSCNCFLPHGVRRILGDLIGPMSDDKSECLAAKLFRLFNTMEFPKSHEYLLVELGIPRITLANHLPELLPELVEELEQMATRMLDLSNVDNSIMLDLPGVPQEVAELYDASGHPNREVDQRLRFYVVAAKKHTARTEEEKRLHEEDLKRVVQNMRVPLRWAERRGPKPIPKPKRHKVYSCSFTLYRAMPLSVEQRLERRRVFPVIQKLYELVAGGATVEQLIQSLDPDSPFGQYAIGKLTYRHDHDPGDAVTVLNAVEYLTRLKSDQRLGVPV